MRDVRSLFRWPRQRRLDAAIEKLRAAEERLAEWQGMIDEAESAGADERYLAPFWRSWSTWNWEREEALEEVRRLGGFVEAESHELVPLDRRHDGIAPSPAAEPLLFAVATALVPKRVADEELGDALEELDAARRSGRPGWWLTLKICSTFVIVLLHGVAYALKGRGK